MGTSGAYGGSPGWDGVRDQTNDWIGTNPSPSGGGNSGGDRPAPAEGPPPSDASPAPLRPFLDPRVVGILQQIGRVLGSTISAGSEGGRGRAAGGTGGGGGGGRSRSGASASGGAAAAGAYGARAGEGASVADLGLTLADLEGLSPYQRAKRIVDAASGPGALVDQSEVRQVNAEVVLWCLTQEEQPSPADVVRRWVLEYVWQVWLTEVGGELRDGTRDGKDSFQLERLVRSTLEASMGSVSLPPDGVRAMDFQNAIEQLIGRLERIFGEAGDDGASLAS